jgi:hypothetical protein
MSRYNTPSKSNLIGSRVPFYNIIKSLVFVYLALPQSGVSASTCFVNILRLMNRGRRISIKHTWLLSSKNTNGISTRSSQVFGLEQGRHSQMVSPGSGLGFAPK